MGDAQIGTAQTRRPGVASNSYGLVWPATAIVAAQAMTARIHVDGIACDRCSARLREGLLKVDGVSALEVNREKNEIVVTFDPQRVTVERIKTEVDHYGFHAT